MKCRFYKYMCSQYVVLLCCCEAEVLFVCWGSQGLQFVPPLIDLPRLASQKNGFGPSRINFNTLVDVIIIDSSRTFSIAIVYMRCIAVHCGATQAP